MLVNGIIETRRDRQLTNGDQVLINYEICLV
ncbi:MAG: RNA-binding S4 domain-containing protein [cyanobacterium endosymbiont of Rhopalodia musculus]|nr:RNA-binding S4 domain-containing protein [cyanobacterium endosymbiont of Epithemia clementina EcSB]WGT66682.1 RNA-binding S4 domain-containing protein [cyanobacterium endosymbiont of Epithemia clementina EcSB]